MILITGGMGYIGSHTVVELVNSGYEVIILDNLSNSKRSVLEKLEFLTGNSLTFYEQDLRDKEKLRMVFQKHEIEAVIHFAGLKAVGESIKEPLAYYDNNVIGTLVLCEVMQEFGCKQLVFSSSATVYGMANEVPFREDMPLSTTNPYGTTKWMIERILQDLYRADQTWRIMLLRYFNPIGAHASRLIGEMPQGIPNNLVPYVMQVAVGELECLQVYGKDYPTADGTGVRDYVHVVDLAKGHLCALDYIQRHEGIETVNLGTGKGYSVLEVVKTFEAISKKKIHYTIEPRRAGDIAICYADTTKAKKLLQWEAKKSLQEMCTDSWHFIKAKKDEEHSL
ncbi:UDP-glucose 4-epimerase GalE [Sporanaerobium hydrogeniformans]|uniref:UDP-glucose 4-epimerase GalE n=1 Tax=Sporanaerobium hydrogeniformans TaxID=3072179 RepID=A0AC61DA32_9FIRM|nr:UDP-glucose 4-epimerase GalE [Sporanaerobium hydrogeniformans]PHV70156.1 UDP-glucose 4-epimerase GalE [Sporanaerobium hydrogeniformans]